MKSIVLLALLAVSGIASASEEEELKDMLDEFLAGASIGDVATHENFWDDNLVYTSSSGADGSDMSPL